MCHLAAFDSLLLCCAAGLHRPGCLVCWLPVCIANLGWLLTSLAACDNLLVCAVQLLLIFLVAYGVVALPVCIAIMYWLLGQVGKARGRVFGTFLALPRPTGVMRV